MSVRKEVFYHNARAVLGKPTKRVWFRLNPLLEKTSLFIMNKKDNSQFTMPLQSVVICERILDDETAFQETCTEAHFWDYLFSENWKNWSTVRVFEGQLMEWLLESLFTLDDAGTIVSHNTGVFTQNIRHIKGPLKGSSEMKEIKETLKISFTYYAKRQGEFDRIIGSSVCSTDTMSVPDIEEAILSDEEFTAVESTASEDLRIHQNEYCGYERPRTRRAVISLDDTLNDYSDIHVRRSFESISEYDEDSEEEGFNVLSPNRVVRSLRGPQISYKEWTRTKQTSKVTRDAADKTHPFLPTIYTLPHFHCERPHFSRVDCPSVMNKKDVRSLAEMAAAQHSAQWLIDTKCSMPTSSGRTVDRLRKRLEDLVEERNRRKQKAKASQGEHLAVAKRIASNYAHTMFAAPVLNRCHAVPSFEQYVVDMIKERGTEQRFRGNRRRIYRYSKRYTMKKNFDQPDFFVEEWKSPKSSARKKNTRQGKFTVKKVNKAQKKQNKSKDATSSQLRSETIREVDETEDTDDNPEQFEKTENLVDIIVGITDCVAFRNNLAMINESDEDGTPPSGPCSEANSPEQGSCAIPDQKALAQNTSPAASLPSSPTASVESSTIDGELSASISPGSHQHAESGSLPKSSARSSDRKSRTSNPEKVAKNSRPNSNKTKRAVCLHKVKGGSPGKTSPTYVDDPEYLTEPSMALIKPEQTEKSVADNLEQFDARKINRKYSFEKLKANRKYQKKHGFRDILKKFTRIQKIASVFRKGAMMKGKKGKQKKTFSNPLVMSPSPEPTENFVGQATKRRDALLPADIAPPDFRHPTAKEFRAQLLVALEEFVVRKEQVTSNYKNRSITSITFTRPDVFAR